MQTPVTRKEFEERIILLRELLLTGKVPPQGREGMLNVQLLPNGRIDMLSIDELTRLNANTMYLMHATDFREKLSGREKESND